LSRRQLAVGVAGLGFGANHARVLDEMEGVRLAALCDPDARRLAAAAEGRQARTYANPGAMLCEERLDALVVAVPASSHEAVALAAVEAGVAVLVEKPLAPSLEAGRRLVEAANAAGVPLMAAHIERFNPALQEMARRVQAGEVGRVVQAVARRASAVRVPPKDVNVVHDSAIHDIDALRFVIGAEVADVYAASRGGVVTGREDAVLGLLRFERGPADDRAAAPAASIEVNWLSPRRLRELSVLGEDGVLVLDYAAQTLDLYRAPAQRQGPVQGWAASRSGGGVEAVRIPIEPREQLVLELEAFASALRDGRPMPVSAQDALAALAVADALTESARSGRPVVPERVHS